MAFASCTWGFRKALVRLVCVRLAAWLMEINLLGHSGTATPSGAAKTTNSTRFGSSSIDYIQSRTLKLNDLSCIKGSSSRNGNGMAMTMANLMTSWQAMPSAVLNSSPASMARRKMFWQLSPVHSTTAVVGMSGSLTANCCVSSIKSDVLLLFNAFSWKFPRNDVQCTECTWMHSTRGKSLFVIPSRSGKPSSCPTSRRCNEGILENEKHTAGCQRYLHQKGRFLKKGRRHFQRHRKPSFGGFSGRPLRHRITHKMKLKSQPIILRPRVNLKIECRLKSLTMLYQYIALGKRVHSWSCHSTDQLCICNMMQRWNLFHPLSDYHTKFGNNGLLKDSHACLRPYLTTKDSHEKPSGI